MKGSDYRLRYADFISEVSAIHSATPVDFVLFNGDIGNEETRHLREAKDVLDELPVPYLVTMGNNDFATAHEWREIWGRSRNSAEVIKERTFALLATSDGEGSEDCPKASAIDEVLRDQPEGPIYLAFHVPPIDRDTLLPTCPKVTQLIATEPRIKAVFNGHVHALDQAYTVLGVPVILDGHVGATTGVPYFGFRVVEIAGDGTIHTWMTDGTRRINEVTLPPR